MTVFTRHPSLMGLGLTLLLGLGLTLLLSSAFASAQMTSSVSVVAPEPRWWELYGVVPAINCVLLLFIIVHLQYIRRELARRNQRFVNIETKLQEIEMVVEKGSQPDGQR